MLNLGIRMDNELLYCGIENRTPCLSSFVCFIQKNFNGSNIFGTRKISSRQGLFKPMRVDYSARSGGFIGTF